MLVAMQQESFLILTKTAPRHTVVGAEHILTKDITMENPLLELQQKS
jgi:hypothetical protein